MKKVILVSLVLLSCVMAKAQCVTIKAGTIVPLQAVSSLKAADTEEGQSVDFVVTNGVKVDGVTVIPQGTIAKGTVTLAKKSSLAGTKGRLTIALKGITLPSGDQLYFTGTNVILTGENRTPLAVITGLFVWPCIFIPGTRAEMPAGYEVDATLASTTTVNIAGN